MASLRGDRITSPNISPSIARQPPSRHDPSQMPSVKEEIITEEMVGGDRTRPYYYRRCKRDRLTNINSLPDELLFEILIRLPAQHIYDQARFVCRKWYRMIHTHDFTHAHLQHTTYGILFRSSMYSDSVMATIKQGQVEISQLKNYRYRSGTSCNGLVSGMESTRIYIINPVTRDVFVLPPFYNGYEGINRCSGIAYAAASMEYKVVSSSYPSSRPSSPEPCAIFTVGVDKSWRIVPTQHLPFETKAALAITPLITEGFLHWPGFRNLVLTLNIETEVFIETPPPVPQLHRDHAAFLSAGRYLSLLVKCGEFKWEVWEMKPDSGEWRKLQLAIEAPKPFSDFLKPIAWLKYPEILVFGNGHGRDGVCLVYNLRTQEIELFELPFAYRECRALVHKSSLVWLAGTC